MGIYSVACQVTAHGGLLTALSARTIRATLLIPIRSTIIKSEQASLEASD